MCVYLYKLLFHLLGSLQFSLYGLNKLLCSVLSANITESHLAQELKNTHKHTQQEHKQALCSCASFFGIYSIVVSDRYQHYITDQYWISVQTSFTMILWGLYLSVSLRCVEDISPLVNVILKRWRPRLLSTAVITDQKFPARLQPWLKHTHTHTLNE